MKKLNQIKILVIFSMMVLPFSFILSQKEQAASANGPSSLVAVTAPDLHVREAADISSKVIGMVHQGDTFEIIQAKNNWDQIKLPGNQSGWVYNAYITPTENIEATVEALVLNIRENPYLSSQITGELKKGTKITVLEEQAGWAKIITSDGIQGWVYEYYITKGTAGSVQTKPVNVPLPSKNISTDNSHQGISSKKSGINTTSPSADNGLSQNSQEPLKGKTIVLDPGHGGVDGGTTSIDGTNEKTLTLATAEAVKQKLENAGADVKITRNNDTYVPLQQRAELSNQDQADAFISFHYNWSDDPTAHGLTDFYYQKSKDDPLASELLNAISESTNLENDGTKFDDLAVLRENSQPSTLIELGFLSNKQDESATESSAYPENVAQGVYQGLLNYFSDQKSVAYTPSP